MVIGSHSMFTGRLGFLVLDEVSVLEIWTLVPIIGELESPHCPRTPSHNKCNPFKSDNESFSGVAEESDCILSNNYD